MKVLRACMLTAIVATTLWIEFVDKDHARDHAYYLTVSGALGRDVAPESWRRVRASTRWSASTASDC